MTYHFSDLHSPSVPTARPERLRQIYLRSLAARTAKEKANLWAEQSSANNAQSISTATPGKHQG